jgi:hypothetical protein
MRNLSEIRLKLAPFSTDPHFIKIKGKTACVALSEEQAAQMSEAIDNHKRLEETVREMREITQTLILETVPGVRRRKPLSEIPKAG